MVRTERGLGQPRWGSASTTTRTPYCNKCSGTSAQRPRSAWVTTDSATAAIHHRLQHRYNYPTVRRHQSLAAVRASVIVGVQIAAEVDVLEAQDPLPSIAAPFAIETSTGQLHDTTGQSFVEVLRSRNLAKTCYERRRTRVHFSGYILWSSATPAIQSTDRRGVALDPTS